MNSTESEEADDDDDQCQIADVHAAAKGLDVYQRERLAYTEIPRSSSRPVSRRLSAVLKAMFHWVCSR